MNAPAADDKTKDELLEEAREKDIAGRSDMTKDELAEALEADSGDSGATATAADPLRHTPGSTTPKTGPVPPAGGIVSGNIPESDRRFGIVPNMSAERLGAKKRAAKERRAEARDAA